MKKIMLSGILCIVLIILFLISSDKLISSKSKNHLYEEAGNIPANKVGLVLGTSKYNQNGNINAYYRYRIEAALELYKAGKISYIVVSGDNGRDTYNEPEEMKQDLIEGGVPAERIYSDYAGFRTLDSIVRIDKIFGQKKFTVISQKFHNERAIYLAQRHGLEVEGYNAKDVGRYYGFKTQVRERFARVKVFIDLLSHKQPRYLGEKITIE